MIVILIVAIPPLFPHLPSGGLESLLFVWCLGPRGIPEMQPWPLYFFAAPPVLRVVSFPASLWSFRCPRASSPRGTSYRLPEHDGSAVLSLLASLFGPTRQVGRGYILSQMLVLLSLFFSLLASFGFGSLFSVARYLCVGLRWRGVCGAFWILLGLRLRSLGACREF